MINYRCNYRSWIASSSAAIAFILSPNPALAIDVQDVPNPRTTGGWVSDTADLISPEGEAELNVLLSELEAESGAEVAVVTVDQTAPATSPRSFTTELFNYWGVGKAEEDNGVVFLISEGDRRAEVVVGYGLEDYLTQTKIEALLRREAIPSFKSQNYEQGIFNASEALVDELLTFSASRLLIDELQSPNAIDIDRQEAETTKTVENSRLASEPSQNTTLSFLKLLFGAIGFSGAGVVLYALLGALVESLHPKCKQCQVKLRKVVEPELSAHLSPAQRKASDLGSATYEGWLCPSCSDISINRRKQYLTIYRNCPRCHEPTVRHTRRTVENPTHHRAGRAEITKKCHCCNYQAVDFVAIAQLSDHRSHSASPHHSYHSTHSHSHHTSSGYTGGNSSSGGGFGGGSSGGGGGGADW